MTIRILAAMAAIFVLAACGGGGTAVRGGPSSPEKVTFASVPGNIIDAPVPRSEWRSIKKTTRVSRVYVFTWTAAFNGGGAIVEKVAPGGLFTGKNFYGENAARRLAAKRGYTSLANVEAVGNQSDRWGWIVDGTRRGKRCVAGMVVTASPGFRYSHQGAGDIIGAFRDCRDDAGARRGDWKLWLRNFRAVGPTYNMLLDR